MADIAFLLLTFWLVTTTMDRDQGVEHVISRKLPPCGNCPDVKERNVLDIIINANDELLIEEENNPIESITAFTQDFYLSERKNMPKRFDVNQAIFADTLMALAQQLKAVEALPESQKKNTTIARITSIQQEWKKHQLSLELLGPYRAIDKLAVIRLRTNSQTSYKAYLNILDQIKGVLQNLRNEEALKAFGVTYQELVKMEEDASLTHQTELRKKLQNKIKAIRNKFPLRIIEPDPRNTKNRQHHEQNKKI